ncbi:MAG: 50S ribosomal protein L6 [Saprospiraceae bacterium]|nr:50S ribosomal protein L6 [Saprospiraceae bacterium]
MSRVGKAPIALPAKVEIDISKGNLVTVKGPKGTLTQQVDMDINVAMEDGKVQVSRPTDQKRHRALHGLYRALINNMVKGVSEGYTSTLELVGVGYKLESKEGRILFTLGYSHPIEMALPSEIKFEAKMEKGSPPTLILSCHDKQLLGSVCAKIRTLRKTEPYKGKGVRFSGEVLRRKAGKTAGGKK